MEFDEVIKKRKSVRDFNDKKVSWKDVIDIIDCALQGPFAGNINNLKFIIVEDKDIINKLAEFSSQDWISEASVVVVVCSDDYFLENKYGLRGRIYSKQQVGAAIENMLLKITDLGLAACWVGAFIDDMVKQILKVPQHIQIEALIPIGYERGTTPKKPKKSIESSIFWENWGINKRQTLSKEPPLINYS